MTDKLFRPATFALVLIAMLPPSVHWVRNPQLAQMEIFLAWWWLWLAVVLLQIALLVWVSGRNRGE